VEALCGSVIHKSGLELSHHDEQDLLAYLLAECWRLSLRYEPARGSTRSFAGWATTNLRLAVIEWQRKRFGRKTWKFKSHTYTRERPHLVPLDDAGLETVESERAGDPAEGCGPPLDGLYADGDRERARDYFHLGLEPPERAA
jgi:hypothetical protein